VGDNLRKVLVSEPSSFFFCKVINPMGRNCQVTKKKERHSTCGKMIIWTLNAADDNKNNPRTTKLITATNSRLPNKKQRGQRCFVIKTKF